MAKLRILMKKEGRSRYISHLDLMRTMRRAFVRAEIPLRHSEGFNPHPIMSFALPLSVCHESDCELLDFEPMITLDADDFKRLCQSLPEGLRVLEIYESPRKFGQIRWLETSCRLIYSNGTPENAVSSLRELFSRESVVIQKRTKRGTDETDIIPMIHQIEITDDGADILIRAVIAAQNPTLNPNGLITAISVSKPELEPTEVSFRRLEVFDGDMKVFR